MSLKATLLVTLALSAGCSLLTPNAPSDVARGEYYPAGQPEFDDFFIELHKKQVEVLQAPNEPLMARKNLTAAVGLTTDASDDSLKDRLGQELRKLLGQGLRVRLEVPEPSPALDASATLYASDTATSTPFRSTLPEEATRLVRSRNRMLATKAELEKLNVRGVSLEGNVNQAFRTAGPWKRDEVRKNLTDGQKVITLMQARAQEVADLDHKLLALLAEIATTDANLGKVPAFAPPPPAEEAPRPAKRGGSRPAPKAATGGGAAPRPAPASKPPAVATPTPKRGSDEDAAAPKPTQGSAPAEIEP